MIVRFASPESLYFLVVLPIVLVFAIALERRGRKAIGKAFGERLSPFLSSSVSRKKRWTKLGLQLASALFFILALARPQFGQSTQEVTSAGVEMVIAVDVSESMLAEDVRPSRLVFAKKEIERFLNRSGGNRVGVVAFAGSAALVSPMTSDMSALLMFIDSLSPESVSTQGTNFKNALEVAQGAFQRGGTEEDESVRATQVVVVVSDGEDHEEGAIEAASALAEKGVRIFSIAVGTEKGAPIPVRDDFGHLRDYKKDPQGQTILSSTKGTILKSIAEAGDGAFYHAIFGGNYLELLSEDINKLEKAEFENSRVTDYEERYQALLLIGLLLALVDLLISERRRDFRLWRGRFEVPPA